MLDIELIRRNPEKVKQGAAAKGEDADVNHLLELDRKRREIIPELEGLRTRRNRASKKIGEIKKQGGNADALVREMRDAGRHIEELETRLSAVEAELQEAMLAVPNIPAPDVPVGPDPEANEMVRTWGERREFDFTPKAHWELGAQLGILDFARATKMAGTGFALFRGDGARLERALFNFMLDLHGQDHQFTEIFPPFLVNRACMTGTGQLPKLEEDMYHLEPDDYFLIPTAEVPVTNLYRDEILSYAELPKYYVAYTACFRREAGSYGKETRGLIRVHQFDKVELVKFVEPAVSYDELESLVQVAEKVLQLLGLEYRVVKLSSQGLSFASAKCYDLEVWAPGIKRWLEVSSCSNFEDFQARRINIRYRDGQGKLGFVHTLNASGVALPRTMIALLESWQERDGSVRLPEVLRPYMDGKVRLVP